ncbi:hypothetical protein AB9K26_00610 [Psychroserpens sp. XS_ASV72]|uniref:hypothetical protein n=1 Tax=Psychroserpens sp. XS_ASV72 TaxID=3241293 RepID=UPI0035110F51
MKLKNILLLTLVLISMATVSAQKIKLKKGFVFIDNEKVFEFEKRAAASEFSLYTIGKEQEILFILRNNNETIGYGDDDFNQIIFIKDNRKLETASLRGYSFKYFIQKLISEKVLDIEGNIDSNKLDTFFSKYDEQITERTIRN